MWPILLFTWMNVSIYISHVQIQTGNIISCFHTSIMHASIRAKDLTAGNELPLDFSRGMIIAFKSSSTFNSAISNWDQAPLINRTDIDLCNINDDIILRITLLRGENKVFFNDRAGKSLLNARGQEQSANLSPMDVNKLLYPGVTISVHDCSTPSKEQYQILFDLTTVYYFDKRFPGPPIKIIYSVQQWPHASTTAIRPLGILSDPLKVFTCNLDDLPVKEKQAIRSGLWVNPQGWFVIAHITLVLPWQLLLQIHWGMIIWSRTSNSAHAWVLRMGKR